MTLPGRDGRLSVETLDGGGLIERINAALDEVVQDIDNPNADPEASRRITVTLTIKSAKDRRSLVLQQRVDRKLAPPPPSSTTAYIRQTRSGAVAYELDPDQMRLFDRDGNVVEIPAAAGKEE